jgi:pimeloyl-ACP methyl ester carboxylesterase
MLPGMCCFVNASPARSLSASWRRRRHASSRWKLCAGAHFWAREIGKLGHDVRLIPPAYVKPFVKRQKNDAADAEAICEAAQRPSMRFVPVKTEEQQANAIVFRARDLLVRQRTQCVNALRGHLLEYGYVFPQGITQVTTLVALIEGPQSSLPEGVRTILQLLVDTFMGGFAAAGAASAILPRASAAQPAPKARNVVLVHGLFADGSCWSEVIARLQAAGINATSVQNPLTTLEESVAAAQRALALQDGSTVLVGHSFSGMIVTEAGIDPKVTALVYVAARAPDAGEDYTALASRFPAPPASAGIVWSGDYGQLSEAAFLRDFAGDLPAAKARVLYAVQAPFERKLLAGKTTHAAWRSKPSWYAVSTEDRTINPDLERFMAKRMGAKTIEVKASHLSLISQPDTITNLILEAAGQA